MVLEVPKTLLALLKDLEGFCQLIGVGHSVPECDFHCPLLSLPLAFKTSITSIPGALPYLISEPAKVRQWQTRLGHKRMPRVGLALAARRQRQPLVSKRHTVPPPVRKPWPSFAPLPATNHGSPGAA